VFQVFQVFQALQVLRFRENFTRKRSDMPSAKENTLTLRHQSLREEKKENRTVILTFVVLRKD